MVETIISKYLYEPRRFSQRDFLDRRYSIFIKFHGFRRKKSCNYNFSCSNADSFLIDFWCSLFQERITSYSLYSHPNFFSTVMMFCLKYLLSFNRWNSKMDLQTFDLPFPIFSTSPIALWKLSLETRLTLLPLRFSIYLCLIWISVSRLFLRLEFLKPTESPRWKLTQYFDTLHYGPTQTRTEMTF